jgi:ribosomal protein L7Ae-like RNA K-turn-binding protein
MKDDALSLIGLIKKSGFLEAGEENCGAACRAGKARALLLAGDAAGNTARRAEHFAGAGRVKLIVTPFSKDELGKMVGLPGCALMAICDSGLASLFLSKLALKDEKYRQDAEEFKIKAEKAAQRKKEMKKHRTGR